MAWSDRRRTRLTAREAERARALYVSGLTMMGQVCAAMGASDKTVLAACGGPASASGAGR